MKERLENHLIVPRAFHNQRIDSVIAQLLPQYSRSQISHWIKTGAITLNQKSCKPKACAMDGDTIDMNIELIKPDTDFNQCAPEPIPLEIIYEDDYLIVLNKPAGLVVHPGAGNKDHTLVNALLYHAPVLQNLPRAGIVHRLDKDTTGLLLVAKTHTAHTALIRQMQAREIQRHYIALVQGHLISGATIDTGFGRHPKNRLKMAVTPNGRQAITHYTINTQYQDFTLLDIALMTGRTHQIRVHMAHINHAIVGDPLYGGRMRFPSKATESFKTLLQQFKRQALHARFIAFHHPETKEPLSFEIPLPYDFAQLLNALEEHCEH